MSHWAEAQYDTRKEAAYLDSLRTSDEPGPLVLLPEDRWSDLLWALRNRLTAGDDPEDPGTGIADAMLALETKASAWMDAHGWPSTGRDAWDIEEEDALLEAQGYTDSHGG